MKIKVWNIVELMNSSWDNWVEEEKRGTSLVDNHRWLLAICFLISAAQARGLNMATGCGETMSNFYRQHEETVLKKLISVFIFSSFYLDGILWNQRFFLQPMLLKLTTLILATDLYLQLYYPHFTDRETGT